MRITVDELDVFKLCGPTYLVESAKPWSHANSLRAAMACLVQAVYALDKDRSVVKMGLAPLAPDWYLPFNYKLLKTVQEAEESEQIVGAVFKWSRRLSALRAGMAPKIVVAFRGTLPFGDTLRSDLRADLDVLMLQLHTAPRFLVALKEVEQAVARYGPDKVCMTGHSLGAAICLLVGRTLALNNCFVGAHLFNPPFPSLDHLLSLKAIAAALVANFINDAVDDDINSQVRKSQDKKVADCRHLKKWRPHLYVNTHDPICAAYVTYFQEIETLQVQHCKSNGLHHSVRGLRSLVQSWVGREAMPFHIIPCACLHFTDAVNGFKKAHGMKQWWSSETPLLQTQFVGLAAAT